MAPIRFSLQISPAEVDLASVGRRAEDAGFDVVTVSDHVGPGLAPMVALAHLAATTSTVRLGTMVLNNDMRNPVQLAWEAATLHRISGGRLELGLGAGHTPHEYAATGIGFDPAPERKHRLAASVEIIRALLAGETVDRTDDHYRIEGASLGPMEHPPPPILVGGNGRALLHHAAANADIIGLQGLGRTLPDGYRHAVRWDPEYLESQVATIREIDRDHRVELNALVQQVEITDDRAEALGAVCARAEGLEPAHAETTPYLAIGTVEEIAEQIMAARERWGLTYYTVRDLAFASVIERLRR